MCIMHFLLMENIYLISKSRPKGKKYIFINIKCFYIKKQTIILCIFSVTRLSFDFVKMKFHRENNDILSKWIFLV